MSCPDWRRLAAWRDDDRPAPAGWSGALEHLARCRDCRLQVAAWDPTLLLAATPPAEVSDAEVADVVTAVRALRRAEALGRPPARRTARAALIAAAVVAGLLAAPAALRWSERGEAPAGRPPAVATVEPAASPPVEELQPAGARVYQFGGDELPVVLIVDETLDF